MSEKYEPSQEEYKEAQEMLTPEQAEVSKAREEMLMKIRDDEALRDSELYFKTSADGDITTVTGRVRDHNIRMMCIGMQQKNKKYIVHIDDYPAIQDNEDAEDLFHKYYNIAKAQSI